MAGIKGSVKVTIQKPSDFFVPLIMMNTNFLEACRMNKIKRLVYTSSIGAYPSKEIFKEKENLLIISQWTCFLGGQREWQNFKFNHIRNNII